MKTAIRSGMPLVSVVSSMFPLSKKKKPSIFLSEREDLSCINIAVIIVSIGIIYSNYGKLTTFANLYNAHSNLKRERSRNSTLSS